MMEGHHIPSDDSFPGDKSPFAAKPRTRIRKRRATTTAPVHGGLPSRISHRGVNDIIPPPNPGTSDNVNSNTGNRKRRCVKALFPEPVNDENNSGSKPARSIANLGNVASTSKDSLHTSADLRSRRDKAKEGLTNKALTSITNRRRRNIVADQNSRHEVSRSHLESTSEEWIFYSVWFPAWDIIWKCHDGKTPLIRNNYFCKLVKKIILDNTGPDLHGAYDLKVMKVQIVGNETNNYKTVGILENLPPKANKKIDWKPLVAVMAKLIQTAASRQDLIVQCVPKNSHASKSKRKTCIVHLTPKDGNKVDFYRLFNSVDVDLVIYNIEYDHHFPWIVKCSPCCGNSVYLKKGEQRQLPATSASLVTNLGGLAVENIVPLLPARSPHVQVVHSSLVADNQLLPSSLSRVAVGGTPLVNAAAGPANDEIDAAFNNVTTNSSPVDVQINGHNVEDEMELMEAPNSDHTGSGIINNSSQNIQSERDEFNLEYFLLNGTFVPGPLRPNVKRSSRETHKYDTLAQLRLMLPDSNEQNISSRRVLLNMMVKQMPHTYGLIIELVPQLRHENAYYVRISDETRESVLLRIHSKDDVPGPTIEVGNIIRVHRVKAQMEWDIQAGANTMVLSTFTHRNYVLFKQSSEEYQFYVNTCAKNITLTESDKQRVGELQLFKDALSKSVKNAAGQLMLDNENQSEGIYDSDLESPPLTLANVSVQANQAQESPMPAACLSAIIDRSDESFFSASEDVIEPDAINFPQGTPSRIPSQLNRVEQNNDFILFKNLRKTEQPLNLLCQIITMCGSLDGNELNLTVRDVEHTIPGKDFKMNQPVFVNQQSCEDCLVINITNAGALEEANKLSMLYDAQGSDEVFSIENVNVNGVSPPYGLQVGGSVCKIRKSPYFNELLGSYSERMTNSNVSVLVGAAPS